MMQVFRMLYIALIGYLLFKMIRRGGCCGGHGHHHGGHRKRDNINLDNSEGLINDDEKNGATDI